MVIYKTLYDDGVWYLNLEECFLIDPNEGDYFSFHKHKEGERKIKL